jgi:hypothetical protein
MTEKYVGGLRSLLTAPCKKNRRCDTATLNRLLDAEAPEVSTVARNQEFRFRHFALVETRGSQPTVPLSSMLFRGAVYVEVDKRVKAEGPSYKHVTVRHPLFILAYTTHESTESAAHSGADGYLRREPE